MNCEEKSCSICGSRFIEGEAGTIYGEAGEWLSEEFWQERGELCPQCLENRTRLAMMYIIDR